MKELLIGEVIRQRRQALGVSQRDLCEGLCQQATLSRLENGLQTPSRALINALLERLGLPGDRFYALLPPQEEQLEALRQELIACNIRFKAALEKDRPPVYRKAMEVIAAMEGISDPEDTLIRQTILRSRAILGKADGTPYSFREKEEMLLAAIRLTVPRFTLEKQPDFLYSMDDIRILNQIALNYSKNDRREEALSIYDQLLRYIQSHCSQMSQAAGPLSMVACNYAGVLRLCERFQEALEIGKLGRTACVQYGHYENLGALTHTMAECYHFLGNDKKSLSLFYQAYHLYKVVDNQKGVELLQADAREYFGNLQDIFLSINGLFP